MTRRLPLAACVALVAMGAAIASGQVGTPRVDDVRCLRGCAGPRTVAVGSAVRFEGRHLGNVSEVRFRGEPGPAVATPVWARRGAVKVEVPDGAASGRPRLFRADGEADRSPRALHIVPEGQLPEPGSFELQFARLRPRHAFFDDRRPLRVNFRFAGYGRLDLRLRLVRRGSGDAIRTLDVGRAAPHAKHSRRWNGLNEGGGVPANGRYAVRVVPAGGGGERGRSFRFHGHRFPVRGSHGYGGPLQRFGAPRSGGRTHDGQDVYAACGGSLEAARGGEVQAKGYHHALYGYWVLVDGRETRADHFYAHMRGPGPLHDGERVHTGERIGAVGRTGNARTTPCHLHFELWPRGYRNGSPADPLPSLRRWDGWS